MITKTKKANYMLVFLYPISSCIIFTKITSLTIKPENEFTALILQANPQIQIIPTRIGQYRRSNRFKTTPLIIKKIRQNYLEEQRLSIEINRNS